MSVNILRTYSLRSKTQKNLLVLFDLLRRKIVLFFQNSFMVVLSHIVAIRLLFYHRKPSCIRNVYYTKHLEIAFLFYRSE